MKVYLSRKWVALTGPEARQRLHNHSNERELSVWAAQPDGVEVAFKELKHSEVGSN